MALDGLEVGTALQFVLAAAFQFVVAFALLDGKNWARLAYMIIQPVFIVLKFFLSTKLDAVAAAGFYAVMAILLFNPSAMQFFRGVSTGRAVQ